MKLFGKNFLLLFLLWSLISSGQEKVVIFSINDMHSRIENFSKIKTLIDKEKREGNKETQSTTIRRKIRQGTTQWILTKL